MNSVPFTRLALVEWRKQLDTRAGKWLLITIAIIIAGVIALMAYLADGVASFSVLYFVNFTPLALLLPVVGILAATSEWSQRTAQVTFTQEPRRLRVGLAKLVSALGSGVLFFVVVLVLAAIFHIVWVMLTDGGFSWSLPAGALWGGLILTLLYMAQGVAFGALIMNSAGAIATFFVLPTVFSVVGTIVSGMRDWMPWLDLGSATGLLLDAGTLTAQQWAQVATASTIWVWLPLALGLIRMARTEIKSA